MLSLFPFCLFSHPLPFSNHHVVKHHSQTTITSPGGKKIRYKETTGKVCETTPGVQSFAGYVDLAEDKHSFFYFFAARNNPETAPITLWLNG